MKRPPIFLPLAVVAGGFLVATAAHAAKRFGPPTTMMMYKYQQVAVVVAAESPEPGKVLFKRKKVLFGEMPRSVVARLDAEALEGLVWGRRYVVTYTEIRRNPRDRDSPERDPDGPKVVEVPVVGSAILEDTPEVRFLFTAVRDTPDDLGRAYLDALVKQLTRPDERTRKFAVTELYMRPQLLAHLREADVPPIRSVLASPETDTEIRSFLLESAMKLPSALQGEWLAEAARDVVEAAGTELDLGTTHPLLVKTALIALEKIGADTDAALAARHFESNAPGVAKAALATLSRLDLDGAARRAREVLDRGGLHPTTRQAMERFLEQNAQGTSGG